MHARILIVICVIMATATEALPASTSDTAWSKLADDTRNSVMYFVETKQKLFLFGKAPAAPAPITTPETTTDTGVVSASTRAPATSPISLDTSTSASATRTSAPATSTSAPATNTGAPATITSSPATSTNAPAKSTKAPATSINASTTSTSAPATRTSAPTTSTSEPSTSSNALLPSSTIPPGYTYYPATRSAYKFHKSDATWDVANTTCAGEGAHVLVVNDAEEADIVARIERDAVSEYYYRTTWTGLRDNRPGGVMDWRTVHGKPLSDVYNVWADGRPLNDAGTTCAVFFAGDRRLYDVPCDSWYYYFTCEISQ